MGDLYRQKKVGQAVHTKHRELLTTPLIWQSAHVHTDLDPKTFSSRAREAKRHFSFPGGALLAPFTWQGSGPTAVFKAWGNANVCARLCVCVCVGQRDDTVHRAEHSCRQKTSSLGLTQIYKQAADEALILTPLSALFIVFFFFRTGSGLLVLHCYLPLE